MSREAHVRFRESVAVRSRRATRPPSEAFFSSLKGELMDGKAFPSRQGAQAAIFEYMEVFYNRQRLHSSLGYMTPVEYEEAVSRGCPITSSDKTRCRPATKEVC